MRSQQVALSVVTASSWLPQDQNISPFNLGFGVVVSGTGNITYTVQHTFNDVLAGSAATAFDHPFVSGQTASRDGNYAFPVAAVRLNVTAVSGVATAEMTLIQAGVAR